MLVATVPAPLHVRRPRRAHLPLGVGELPAVQVQINLPCGRLSLPLPPGRHILKTLLVWTAPARPPPARALRFGQVSNFVHLASYPRPPGRHLRPIEENSSIGPLTPAHPGATR